MVAGAPVPASQGDAMARLVAAENNVTLQGQRIAKLEQALVEATSSVQGMQKAWTNRARRYPKRPPRWSSTQRC